MNRFTFGREFNRHPPQVYKEERENVRVFIRQASSKLLKTYFKASSFNLLDSEGKRYEHCQKKRYFEVHGCSSICSPRVQHQRFSISRACVRVRAYVCFRYYFKIIVVEYLEQRMT